MRFNDKTPLVFRLFPIIFGLALVGILAWWGFIAFVAVKGVIALDGCTPAITAKDVDGEQQYSVGCKK